MKTAIAYVRVSTEEQAVSGLGLADQRARIAAYCTLRGLELVRTVEDGGVSGGKPLASRPGGGQLVRALQQRQARHVVFLKLDRGFRNAADCLATVEGWERRGVTLHIVDLGGNAIDTASAAGKFMLTVLAGAAEMERNLTRERTRAALRVKRERGERISRFAPFGYKVVARGRLKAVASEQAVVVRIRRLHTRGLSLRQIAVALADGGWSGRNGQPISAKTVHSVLRRTSGRDRLLADLHSVEKQSRRPGTCATPRRARRGSHADRFMALALALHAGDTHEPGPMLQVLRWDGPPRGPAVAQYRE